MVQEATNLDKTAEFIILRLEQVTEKKSQSFIHVAGCLCRPWIIIPSKEENTSFIL